MLLVIAWREGVVRRRIAPGDYEAELTALCGSRWRARRLIREELHRQPGLSRAGAALALVGIGWLMMGSGTEVPVQTSPSAEPPVVEAPADSAKPPRVEPSASASAQPREPQPREPQPRESPTREVPPPIKQPPRPTLDCKGKDFANPACARR